MNEVTHESVELVYGADVTFDEISSPLMGVLNIKLSNLTVSTLHQNVSVPGIIINWQFTPRVDPEERRVNRAWTFGDKKLEENRRWFCEHRFSTVPPASRDAVDKQLAFDIYNGRRNHYCLPD